MHTINPRSRKFLVVLALAAGACDPGADIAADNAADESSSMLTQPTAQVVLDCSKYKGLLHPLFSNNAVLQRGVAVPVWGCTTPGASVAVAVGGRTASATADAKGLWQVRLSAMQPGGPYVLTAKTSTTIAQSTNIYVGDVFLCGGQSNMEFRADAAANSAPVRSAAVNEADIHYFFVPHETARGLVQPQQLFDSGAWPQTNWLPPSTNTVNRFSAVCLFFAMNLHAKTKVPYGLINASYGGSQIQWWNSIDVLLANKGILDAQTQSELPQVQAGTTPAGTVPFASSLFNSMISPLAPYAIKALVFYQGENNRATSSLYATLLGGMIADWRARFGINFPAVVVQLPRMPAATPVDGTARIREAELRVAQTTASTGLAVTIDTGDPSNMHPVDKRDVGDRVSTVLDGMAFGGSSTYTGPLYKSMTVENGKIRIAFDFVGTGLMVGKKVSLQPVTEVVGGTLTGFSVAGVDNNFVPATAVISGSTVLVSASSVAAPRNVRYGWDNAPSCNLYNKSGLPASPFRTDKL